MTTQPTQRCHALAVAVGIAVVVSACGEDGEPSDQSTNQTAPLALVVERREMTEADYDRIDDDGEGGVLDCQAPGGFNWDYGPIDPDAVGDDVADDALVRAISDINEDSQADVGKDVLPETGWIEMTVSESRSVFLLSTDQGWQAIVKVGGSVDQGIWRHNEAVLCGEELRDRE